MPIFTFYLFTKTKNRQLLYNRFIRQTAIILQTYYQQKIMPKTKQDTQELCQRSDILSLADQGERNNFNIRRFKQSNLNKDKRNSLYTKFSDLSTKNRINTEPVDRSTSKNQMKSQMLDSNAFDRIMTKKEPDHQKRNTMRGSLKNALTKFTSFIENEPNFKSQTIQDIQLQKALKFKMMDKKSHKGPINKKIIQTWLNSILMESTQFEVVDESLGNAALKKFQIDENSLLSRSIKPNNIPRIYQALFVHSIGFNNNIKELVGGNIEVAKNIWKVFSILLQYCAEGKFETIVGVIEKEKVMKVEELRQEVAKRQQIIDRNDQLNQTKNIQIFKQIRALKQQNLNLKNEKQILFEDYQKTEQAFNEEVALRLKFQNKINQLFGIHRELAVKHSRLYDDFKKKVLQCQISTQKNIQLTKENGQYKIEINDLTSQNQRLTNSEKFHKQLLSSLKQEKVKRIEQLHFLQHQYDEQRRLSKQFKRRITQLQIEAKNLQQVSSIKDKSLKQTYSEYQLLVEENKRLYLVITEQRTEIQSLLLQKKEFNNKALNIMAQASFERKKKEQYINLYYESDKALKQKVGRIKNLQLQVQILSKRKQSLQQDIKIDYQNIEKMHKQNYLMEQQLLYLRKFQQNLYPIVQEKDRMVQMYRQRYEKFQIQNNQLKSQYNKLQLSNRTTQQQLNFEISNLNQKLQKYKQQFSQLEMGDSQRNRIIMAMKMENERLTKQLHSTIMDLKSQKFERFNLKANYDQSLMMLDKKNANQKQLGRNISQLKEQVAKFRQQKQKVELQYQNQILRRQRVESQLEQTQKQYSEYKQLRFAHVHPMVVQDIKQNFRKKVEKLKQTEKKLKEKEDQLRGKVEKYEREAENTKKTNEQYLQNYKIQKEKQIFQKQAELQYERQINSSQKSRLQELELLTVNYEKKIKENESQQVAKIYTEIIEEKTKNIQQLMAKLKIESSKNEQLNNKVIEKQEYYSNQIVSKSKQYKIQKTKLQQKINTLQFESDFYKKQADQYQKEIRIVESTFEERLKERMELYLQNYKKSQSLIPESEERLKSLQDQEAEDRKQKNMNTTKGNWGQLQKIQKNNPEIKKRNNISRKLKITYNYYKHQQ